MNETQQCVQIYAHILFRAERRPQVSSTSTNIFNGLNPSFHLLRESNLALLKLTTNV